MVVGKIRFVINYNFIGFGDGGKFCINMLIFWYEKSLRVLLKVKFDFW